MPCGEGVDSGEHQWGFVLTAGQSVYLEIPDLAEIGIAKMSLIEKSTHIFKDGEHKMKLEMRVEE